MPFTYRETNSFAKERKSLCKKNNSLLHKIKEEVEELVKSPKKGDPKTGPLKGYWTWSFGKSPEYRIFYQIHDCELHVNCKFADIIHDCDENECEGLIEIILIRTREAMKNIYNMKDKRFKP